MGSKKLQLPKIFRGILSAATYEKRIQQKIYLASYRDFLESVTEKDSAGNYCLKQNLAKNDVKMLNKIAHSIKANTGFVQKTKLYVVFILSAAIMVFNLVFLDKIVESWAEQALTGVFKARVDISHLHVNIFGGEVAFRAMTVGHSTQDYKNLFELGQTALEIDTLALLKGKFILNNIICQNIDWNTDRTTVGTIPAYKATLLTPKNSEKSTTDKPATDFLEVGRLEIAKIIEEQSNNLQSKRLVSEFNQNYTQLPQLYQSRLEGVKSDLESLETDLEKIKAVNIKKIYDAAKATELLQTVSQTAEKVKNLNSTVKKISTDFAIDTKKVAELSGQIMGAFQADYQYLLAFADFQDPKYKSITSSLADAYIKTFLGELAGYAGFILSILDSLQVNKTTEPSKITTHSKGRTVRFPGVTLPGFWLKNLDISVGQPGDRDLFLEARVTDICSEPDLIGKATLLIYQQVISGIETSVRAALDTRKRAALLMEASITVKKLPF